MSESTATLVERSQAGDGPARITGAESEHRLSRDQDRLSQPSSIGPNNPNTPVEQAERRARWLGRLLWLMAILAVAGLFLGFQHAYPKDRPVVYSDLEEHFKYGSIGSDRENGLPLQIIRVLPRMFPQYLPDGYKGPLDYRAFGMVYEDGKELPIGFSVRRQYIDLIGLNCSVCHIGTFRRSESEPPVHYLAAGSNTFDILGFFEFLFKCAADSRFTGERIIAEIEKDRDLSLVEKFFLEQLAIPRMQAGLLQRRVKLEYIFQPGYPRWGAGAVDTFNPYKRLQFAADYPHGIPVRERFGVADFPVVWNQDKKRGMQLHWDGNNDSVHERNISAAFGAGVTREGIDIESVQRAMEWLFELPPPPFIAADDIDRSAAERGQAIYRKYCYDCHDFKGSGVGKVLDIGEIRTDPGRLDSFTEKFVEAQKKYTQGYDWSFTHFRKTNGYANMPLDGLWARAPYLHNGSVPTMWDLLTRENQRPERFYRGHGVYDIKKLGIRGDVREIDGRPAWLHDTRKQSKGNQGHSGPEYGTELTDNEKWDLIEYLKTL
ncbi:MAG: c-type cytochrome [Proteobacteria bacterium]|nr:c-type cytochrome [Pseudomonadota bacterium]